MRRRFWSLPPLWGTGGGIENITKSIFMEYTIEHVRYLEQLYKTAPKQVPERLKHLADNRTKEGVIIAFGDSPVSWKQLLFPSVISLLEGNLELSEFAKEWAEAKPFWQCGWGVSGGYIYYRGEKKEPLEMGKPNSLQW